MDINVLLRVPFFFLFFSYFLISIVNCLLFSGISESVMMSLIVMHKHINNVSFFHVNIQVSSRECSFGITIHQVFKVGPTSWLFGGPGPGP